MDFLKKLSFNRFILNTYVRCNLKIMQICLAASDFLVYTDLYLASETTCGFIDLNSIRYCTLQPDKERGRNRYQSNRFLRLKSRKLLTLV
jgi:hypothetical protein